MTVRHGRAHRQTRGRYLQVQNTSDGSPGPNSQCLQNATRAPWWHQVGSRRRKGRLRWLRGHWVGGLLLQGPEKIAGRGDHKERACKSRSIIVAKIIAGIWDFTSSGGKSWGQKAVFVQLCSRGSGARVDAGRQGSLHQAGQASEGACQKPTLWEPFPHSEPAHPRPTPGLLCV